MVNERGKSDPAIVATNPVNKAEQSAAERGAMGLARQIGDFKRRLRSWPDSPVWEIQPV
jgi:hypothetical protein